MFKEIYLKNAEMTIRALIVDDSALIHKLLSDILSQDLNPRVIGTVFNGKDGVEKLKIKLSYGLKELGSRPSVNSLFRSIAQFTAPKLFPWF